jgi:hypothetical protein
MSAETCYRCRRPLVTFGGDLEATCGECHSRPDSCPCEPLPAAPERASSRPTPDVIAELAARYGDPVKVAAVLIGEYGLSARVAQATARTACPPRMDDGNEQETEPPEPLPEIPRFPVKALIGPLRAFVNWGIRDGLHPECTAAAGLSALVTVTGPGRLKLGATLVKPILWIPLVGKASAGKSPAYMHAYAKIRQEYASKREEYEMALGQAKKNDDDAPTRPQPYELDDATTEAVARWLDARGRDTSGSIVDDELAAFLEGLNQYKGGQGSDLSKWLKMWTGAPLHIQRVGAGGMRNAIDLYIPDPVVSVTGPLVPSNLHLLGKPGSGFRPRWLPFFAPSTPPEWHRAGEHPATWTGCIDALMENRAPREWTLDGDALTEWEKARKRWSIQQSDPEPDDVIEALRKADQQALRVALVIAESLNPGNGGPVPVKAVRCAVAILDYCIKVWRALPGNSTMLTSRREEVMDAGYRRLLDWLETRPVSIAGLPEGSKPRPGATRRDLMQWIHESPEKIDELIAMHRRRWPSCVIVVKPKRGPSATWLYAPPRADVFDSRKLLRQQFPDTYEDIWPEDKTTVQDTEGRSPETVAVTVADPMQQFPATVSGGSAGGLRTIACPDCGTTARTAVEPGEAAYCKHCDAEYIAA